jgi:hypothetical protein
MSGPARCVLDIRRGRKALHGTDCVAVGERAARIGGRNHRYARSEQGLYILSPDSRIGRLRVREYCGRFWPVSARRVRALSGNCEGLAARNAGSPAKRSQARLRECGRVQRAVAAFNPGQHRQLLAAAVPANEGPQGSTSSGTPGTLGTLGILGILGTFR